MFSKTKRELWLRIIGGFVLSLLLVASGWFLQLTQAAIAADVPITMGYQGRLKDSGGTALSGTYDFTIRIYNALTGGSSLFSETHSDVTVTNGYFTLVIGSVDASTNPLDLDFDTTYYISTEIESDGEMSPRTKINSAAYAFRAGGIETAASAPSASSSSVLREGRIYFNTGDNTIYVYTSGSWVAASGGGGGGAPTDATYLVTSANGTLTNEVVTSSLAANLTFAGDDSAARTITLGQTNSFDDVVVIDAGNWSVDSSGNTVLGGTLAVNGDSITSDGATLTINAGGAVDVQDNLTADSLTADTGGVTVAAGQGIDVGSAGALTIGNSTATSLSLCNSAACDTITIGTNADANAITIGEANDTVIITSANWSIDTNGDLIVNGCTGCGGGGGAPTGLHISLHQLMGRSVLK
ncbi:MAG: hypothetical protein R3B38_00480 [Patescibacteria group bacterium]